MEDTVIIGMSGKKQSGKTLTCQYIQNKYGCSSPNLMYPNAVLYSFADMLKQKVCMDTMGLTDEQCNGTDEQKNTPTMYKWENLPNEIQFKYSVMKGTSSEWYTDHNGISHGAVPRIYKEGFMTGREVMQIVGTDIFRKYFDNDIWVNATFRKIKEDKPVIALISDARFPGEIDAIINNGGYVIRLLRDVCESDPHESETALDDYDFAQWGDRVCVVDNQNMSIEEKNVVVDNYLEGKSNVNK